MPILEVELVGQPAATERRLLARRIAEATSTVFGSAPERTWVRLRVLPRADYAEGGGGPAAGTAPVFVSVLLADVPEPAERKSQARALADAVAGACNRRPEHVHIVYQPPARERVAFGGELLGD